MKAPDRLRAIDWTRVAAELDSGGNAVIEQLIAPAECEQLVGLYADDSCFRSRIVMARHGFGRGEYKYFAYPLPEPVAALREALYPSLAEIANRWNEALAIGPRYPRDHASYLARCHQAGQVKPTPLLLRYGAGDYNCLHQDLYGELVFPLQVTFLLSRKPPRVSPSLQVNYKDTPENALEFLGELGDPYAKIGADATGRTGLDWGIYGVPETFVVGPGGTILLRFPGPLSPDVVERRIRPAMAAAG